MEEVNSKVTSMAEFWHSYKSIRYAHQKNDPREEKNRKKRYAILNKRQLSSYMNDTKWLKLLQAVSEELAFPPPFQLKHLLHKTPWGEDLTKENESKVSYHGDWTVYYKEGLPPFELIEWLKVRAKCVRYQGQLLPNHLDDETDAFRAILLRLNLFFEEEADIFTIYGYR